MRRISTLLALVIGAITLAAGDDASASSANPPPGSESGVAVTDANAVRAHVLFDDSRNAPRAGVAAGTRPSVPRRVRTPRSASTQAAASTSAPPDPEVLGFAQSGEVVSGAWQTDLNMSLLSTIALFGVNVNGDGSLVTNDSGYQGLYSSQATALINSAHAAGARVVVVVKAFDNPTIASVDGYEGYRQRMVGNVLNLITSRNLDGVNIDFEGYAAPGDFTVMCQELKAALNGWLPQASYLSVDTFGSAYQGGELFDLSALRPYVDAFMVMAYDLNFGSTLPNSPLFGPYGYTDQSIVNGYLRYVSPGQLILGVPYYGYKYSTSGNGFNSARVSGSGLTADTYAGVVSDLSCAQQASVNWDAGSATPWASWYSPPVNDPCQGNHNSWREVYYDDANSLGYKYDLVNNSSLRGVGIWALGYDNGALWNVIARKFTVAKAPLPPVIGALPNPETSTGFPISWSLAAGSVSASSYLVFARDGQGPWLAYTRTSGTSTTFFGSPGHAYAFHVVGFAPDGQGSGWPPGPNDVATQVAANATLSTPFKSMYAVDGYGVIHPASSPPLEVSATWPGWDIGRGMTSNPDGRGGLVLDGWGSLHPYGSAAAAAVSGYWPGWDIAVGAGQLPDASGGYVLDGWGGLHPYASAGHAWPAAASPTGYWQGWKIARGLAMLPDGQGGVVLDGWGGLHPFSLSGHATVAAPIATGFWQGWDIARAVAFRPGSTASNYSGYVLDGWGGLHPFTSQGAAMPPAASGGRYWAGWDIARSVVMPPAGGGLGYIVDGFGSYAPFNGAPGVFASTYSGFDITRGSGAS